MKLKFILLTAVSFLFAGCVELEGQLNVMKAFSVRINNGLQTIQVGNYKTGLDFKRNRVVAKIQTGSNPATNVNFTIPANAQLPDNGHFELRAAQTGQPVDIYGQVKTVTSQSALQRGYENCQYQDHAPVCGQNGCLYPPPRWGRQYTEYYLNTTDKTITFAMTEVGYADKKLAQFNGANQSSHKVIVRQDQCF